MPLPLSFTQQGFITPARKFKGLLIGTEGHDNTGKSEFIMSAPGPGIALALDRSYEAMMDNQEPPDTRRVGEWVWVPVKVPMATQLAGTDQFKPYWDDFFLKKYVPALDNADARSVAVDGDSDGWELQTLATFGKLTQIPPILRTGLNASRRAYIARSHDSGKIVIHTNKLKKKYFDQYNPDGSPKMGTDGKVVREWDGLSYERQGFWDHDYLYAIQIKHLYRQATDKLAHGWGIRILKCKANNSLVGVELWDGDANMPTLLELVYPHIPMTTWGYPR